MTKKRARFDAKRLQYRLKTGIMRIKKLENENRALLDEIKQLKTADFNRIFHLN